MTETQVSASGCHVLLAEDSSVTQDLVKLILTQNGHRVDIFDDGPSALDALLTDTYDVALLDFHLPGMSGLDVVTSFLEEKGAGPRPKFVAITGDVKGLLKDQANCELFDLVVPKPLDIDVISEVVDTAATTAAATRVAPPTASGPMIRGPTPAAASPALTAASSAASSAIVQLGFSLLRWPDRERTKVFSVSDYDAVMVESPDDLDGLWALRGAHLLPVIDLSGKLGPSADLDASALGIGYAAKIRDLIDRFGERRAQLHPDPVRSDDMGDKLLGRMHVSGGAVIPRRDGRQRGLVAYNTVLSPDVVTREVRKLADGGFLDLSFFDRLHVCGRCASARHNVREECPGCGSADLTEESYLHHFRCAYQGPESDFRKGDDLVCPKCRRALTHFGRDYDRPGTMVRCRSCATTTSEPKVAFVCADCDTRADGDTVPTHDIVEARLSDQAKGYLKAGESFLGLAQKTLRFADLPLDLVIALNRAARGFNEDGTPFALSYVSYGNEAEIQGQAGARSFAEARRIFLESLQQALHDEVQIARGAIHDFVLMPGRTPQALEASLRTARDVANRAIRFDLGAEFHLVGPEDIAS
ncbi:MAG: response regulator [Inquilinaceae bacterium]